MGNIHVVNETSLTSEKKRFVLVLPYLDSIYLKTRNESKKSFKNILSCFKIVLESLKIRSD